MTHQPPADTWPGLTAAELWITEAIRESLSAETRSPPPAQPETADGAPPPVLKNDLTPHVVAGPEDGDNTGSTPVADASNSPPVDVTPVGVIDDQSSRQTLAWDSDDAWLEHILAGASDRSANAPGYRPNPVIVPEATDDEWLEHMMAGTSDRSLDAPRDRPNQVIGLEGTEDGWLSEATVWPAGVQAGWLPGPPQQLRRAWPRTRYEAAAVMLAVASVGIGIVLAGNSGSARKNQQPVAIAAVATTSTSLGRVTSPPIDALAPDPTTTPGTTTAATPPAVPAVALGAQTPAPAGAAVVPSPPAGSKNPPPGTIPTTGTTPPTQPPTTTPPTTTPPTTTPPTTPPTTRPSTTTTRPQRPTTTLAIPTPTTRPHRSGR